MPHTMHSVSVFIAVRPCRWPALFLSVCALGVAIDAAINSAPGVSWRQQSLSGDADGARQTLRSRHEGSGRSPSLNVGWDPGFKGGAAHGDDNEAYRGETP